MVVSSELGRLVDSMSGEIVVLLVSSKGSSVTALVVGHPAGPQSMLSSVIISPDPCIVDDISSCVVVDGSLSADIVVESLTGAAVVSSGASVDGTSSIGGVVVSPDPSVVDNMSSCVVVDRSLSADVVVNSLSGAVVESDGARVDGTSSTGGVVVSPDPSVVDEMSTCVVANGSLSAEVVVDSLSGTTGAVVASPDPSVVDNMSTCVVVDVSLSANAVVDSLSGAIVVSAETVVDEISSPDGVVVSPEPSVVDDMSTCVVIDGSLSDVVGVDSFSGAIVVPTESVDRSIAGFVDISSLGVVLSSDGTVVGSEGSDVVAGAIVVSGFILGSSVVASRGGHSAPVHSSVTMLCGVVVSSGVPSIITTAGSVG